MATFLSFRLTRAKLLLLALLALPMLLVPLGCSHRDSSLSDTGDGGATDDPATCVFRDAVRISRAGFDLVTNETHVYWIYDGSVMRSPVAGGAPEVVAANREDPRGLALDATYVYWTDSGSFDPSTRNGKVMRAELDGANPFVIAENQDHPWAITVDATNVYWANYSFDGRIMKASLQGEALTELAQSTGAALGFPIAVGVSATHVVWIASNTGRIMKVPLSGGDSSFLLANEPLVWTAQAMILRDGQAYWSTGRLEQASATSIIKLDLASGTLTTLATHQSGGTSLAVDANTIFWTDWTIESGFDGHISMVPVSGGAATTFVGGMCSDAQFPHRGFPGDIAIDAKNVYWQNGDYDLWKAPR